MWEIVSAGGLLMLPIIICSIVALAIVAERFWTLRRSRVLPSNLVADVWRMASTHQLSDEKLRELRDQSPLGRVLAAGLLNRANSREQMKTQIEEVGGHVAHELERYLPALGSIAAVTPLMGLLGTVIGMISVFTNITTMGVGNPSQLAGGISQALVTTAGGLVVAIPALLFYRYFRAKVDSLVVDMEKESMKLVDVMQRRRVPAGAAKAGAAPRANAPQAAAAGRQAAGGAVPLDATQSTARR